MKRFRLTTKMKRHQSQKSPSNLLPKVIEFMRYTRTYFEDHLEMNLDSIYAMDETAVWFDACGSRTVDSVGAKSVSLTTTGHDKQNVTVALTAVASGAKKLSFIVFKGKGKTAEDRTLKARRDVIVAFSDNGWLNTNLTIDWLTRVLCALEFSQRLLIWDSYRCHVCRDVDKVRQKFKIHSADIRGGCTSYIQAPDVPWNKVFKSSLREQYDYWLDHGKKSFTASGNMRAVSKSVLCDMVVEAWVSLTPDLIKRSFECCGQVPGASSQNIT